MLANFGRTYKRLNPAVSEVIIDGLRNSKERESGKPAADSIRAFFNRSKLFSGSIRQFSDRIDLEALLSAFELFAFANLLMSIPSRIAAPVRHSFT